jgi:hypothetical protein
VFGGPQLHQEVRASRYVFVILKPTALVADSRQDVTKRGDLVSDIFLGAGTTLVAESERPPVAAGLFQVLALKGTAAHVSGGTRPLALMTKVIAINCD